MITNNYTFFFSYLKIHGARITGAVLLLFVIGHMLGNLQILLGRDAVNRYADLLHGNPELLWAIRLGLLGILALHVWSSVFRSVDRLTAVHLRRTSNQLSYRPNRVRGMMIMTGMIILIFLIYHLLHFSLQAGAFGWVGSGSPVPQEVLVDGSLRRDVHATMILVFSDPFVSLIYLFGIGFLCLHMARGLASLMPPLGTASRISDRALERSSKAIACLVFLGYAIVPCAILLGLGKGVS